MRVGVAIRRGLLLSLGTAAVALATAIPARAQTGLNLTLRYTDSQGSGCLTLQSASAADATGGSQIVASLTQNGMTFNGQGEEWSLSQTAPRSTALAFWLDDGNGDTYFFDGVLQMGVDTLNGQGGWISIQNPSLTDQWQAFASFPPRPCS